MYPMPVDLTFQANASPRAATALAGLMVDEPSGRSEYETNRNMLAALEANPAAARRLERNRLLLIIVPSVAFVVLLLIVLLI